MNYVEEAVAIKIHINLKRIILSELKVHGSTNRVFFFIGANFITQLKILNHVIFTHFNKILRRVYK